MTRPFSDFIEVYGDYIKYVYLQHTYWDRFRRDMHKINVTNYLVNKYKENI